MRKHLIILLVGFTVFSCIEPFEFETETFEDALVIEASLTNEMKRHQVKLSRAVRFEDSISAPESNAQVRILDEMQNVYEFQEAEAGVYSSTLEFAAQKSTKYTLEIETSDGTSYSSEPESFESESQLENVYADRGLNDMNEDGIFVYTDSFDSSGDSQYYRYEYEETYKIIAPFWTSVEFELTNYQPCNPDPEAELPIFDLEIVPREEEQETCYNTVKSNDIIQASSAGLSAARVEGFPVRFIPGSDFILTHRYSVLVKQYVQSANAFSYYQSLEDFSSSESVFSEIQPGFLTGNITVANNADKMVLGYFEVASVSQKRIFLGYRDFYPNAPLPLYIKNCVLFTSVLAHVSFCNVYYTGSICSESLIERIARNSITYVDGNDDGLVGLNCIGPYVVVDRECGDCTALGSNVVPDFWIE